MEQGWECIKCHNIYAPNIPFCLYCWFQNKTKSTDINLENTINEKNTESLKDTVLTNITEESSNQNLIIPNVDIVIPTLNKESIYPQSNKFPDTKIFLSGIGHAKDRAIHREFIVPYILDSIMDFPSQPSKLVRQYFDYIHSNNIEYLFDSGAFTYMSNPKKSIDLNDYIKRYCYYINEFDIKNFFELDLDIFLSIEQIENIRRKIYLETHKQPIIVFHEERGHDYWIKMCKENEFIAIGGIASAKAYTQTDYDNFSILCEEAHTYNTKVHGLGFTPLSILNARTMFFDTVDSTSWNFSKHGYSAKINEKGELVKAEMVMNYMTIESQENDLRVWSEFSKNYRGKMR